MAPIPKLLLFLVILRAVNAIQSAKVTTIEILEVRKRGRLPIRSTMNAANIASTQLVVA
jgi:hypothetical protein